MISPLFPHVHDLSVHVMRISHDGVPSDHRDSTLSEHLLPIGQGDLEPISSVTAAEQRVMELTQYPVTSMPLDQQILHSSDQISRQSHRGAATVILMHPQMLDYLINNFDSEWAPLAHEEMVGQWCHKGTLNHTMALYVLDSMDENRVFLAHVGLDSIVDGPGALIEHENQLTYYQLPTTSAALGTAQDYVAGFSLAGIR